MKAKKSADFRAYVRGSKCAGCPRWGKCAVKCKIDAADIKAAKAGPIEARPVEGVDFYIEGRTYKTMNIGGLRDSI